MGFTFYNQRENHKNVSSDERIFEERLEKWEQSNKRGYNSRVEKTGGKGMRYCRDCGRFTFNHNPNKGSRKCPQCNQQWSCDMCDNDMTADGGTLAGVKCFMCSGGYIQVESWRQKYKGKRRKA